MGYLLHTRIARKMLCSPVYSQYALFRLTWSSPGVGYPGLHAENSRANKLARYQPS